MLTVCFEHSNTVTVFDRLNDYDFRFSSPPSDVSALPHSYFDNIELWHFIFAVEPLVTCESVICLLI